MHRTYIGGIERGERNVSFANFLRIANALGERPSKLLERCEDLLLGSALRPAQGAIER